MEVDSTAAKRGAEAPLPTLVDAKKMAPGSAQEPLAMAVSTAACAASEDSGLQEVLAAFAVNVEGELQGKLAEMLQSSLSGLLAPMERRQAEMKKEQSQPHARISHEGKPRSSAVDEAHGGSAQPCTCVSFHECHAPDISLALGAYGWQHSVRTYRRTGGRLPSIRAPPDAEGKACGGGHFEAIPAADTKPRFSWRMLPHRTMRAPSLGLRRRRPRWSMRISAALP